MCSIEGQTYCLRWNNHKSNLVEILDALIKMECYVDCTIYVDEQIQFKAHRVVLAANSPYFQSILQDVPMDHCSILFPGVKAFEMRALLEYMYTGEVNVTQSQIPRIMKIAEQLEVKGLFDMTDLKDKFNKLDTEHPMYMASQAAANRTSSNSSNNNSISAHNTNGKTGSLDNGRDLKLSALQSSPIISTTSSTNVSSHAAQSSSSPPYSFKPMPYSNLYSRSPVPSASSNLTADRHHPPPAWHTHLPNPLATTTAQQQFQNAAVAMLSSVYESGPDMNPLKRKKLSSMSSMLMSRDTPILRNVLAQPNAADSSQGSGGPSLGQPQLNTSGGSIGGGERNNSNDRHSSQSNGSAEYSMKVSFILIIVI